MIECATGSDRPADRMHAALSHDRVRAVAFSAPASAVASTGRRRRASLAL